MVKNTSRPRGRPRKFDEAEALERATDVFWSKGYDGATIDDLVEGTGICRPSLYTTFGDKAALFKRCLEAYQARLGGQAFEALLGPPDVEGAVRGLLRFSVEHATRENSPWGCLMVCVAPLVEDEQVREFLLKGGKLATEAVQQRLKEGVESGELPPDFPTAVRARQIMDLSRGLIIRARIGVPRAELLEDAEAGASLILRST